jgi:outer membrane immunogenic protein
MLIYAPCGFWPSCASNPSERRAGNLSASWGTGEFEMKRLLLASVALSAFTGAEIAAAADVPPEVIYPAGYPAGSAVVPPVGTPRFTFNGFYAGGTIGGAAGSSKYSETPSGAFVTLVPAAIPSIAAVGTSSIAPRGVIGGAEVGYNWQVGHFVLGFETDFSGWDMSASSGVTPRVPTPSSTTSFSSNWLFTARPRLGFANGNMLTYVTGGLAVTSFSLSQSILLSGASPALTGAASSTAVGWTAGLGIEYALSWNWSIKAEYLYVSFPNQSVSQVVPSAPAFTGTVTGNLTASIARAGFEYRF